MNENEGLERMNEGLGGERSKEGEEIAGAGRSGQKRKKRDDGTSDCDM